MPSADITTKKILIAARQLISDPDEWTKGANKNKLCAEAAIDQARSNLGASFDEVMHAKNALVNAFGRNSTGIQMQIINWNDAPGRKHDDVLAAFDKAIGAQDAGP